MLYLTVGDVMSQTDSDLGVSHPRVLEALENSTREVADLRGTVASLEKSLGERMDRLEGAVSNTNAHLDNVAREANKANSMLETDIRDRRVAREKKEEEDAEERKRLQSISDDNRETVKRALRELWAVFKQPLGFLVAGAFAWFVYQYMSVPPNTTLPLPRGVNQEAALPQEDS